MIPHGFYAMFSYFSVLLFVISLDLHYLCPRKAQMAESVDALVSNTSGATRAGSTPALGTENGGFNRVLRFSFYRLLIYRFMCFLTQASG